MFVNRLHWVSHIVFLYCVRLRTKLLTFTRDFQPLDNKLYRTWLSSFGLRSVIVDQSNLLFTLKYTWLAGMYIFINHRTISAGSHWIKLITWYKIGRWISEDFRHPIWYPSSDFISTEGKPKNEQTLTISFKLVKENQKKTFCRSQWRINKKLVDNSVPRNTKKSTKYAATIYVRSPWEIIQRNIK